MQLKRLYDWNADKEDWVVREQPCSTCRGKGVVVNEAGDGVETCSDCEEGIQRDLVPPVSGVEIRRYNPEKQNFPIRTVDRGQREGWLKLEGSHLIVSGANKILTYQIKRAPGKYPNETIHYYECELVKEEDNG